MLTNQDIFLYSLATDVYLGKELFYIAKRDLGLLSFYGLFDLDLLESPNLGT